MKTVKIRMGDVKPGDVLLKRSMYTGDLERQRVLQTSLAFYDQPRSLRHVHRFVRLTLTMKHAPGGQSVQDWSRHEVEDLIIKDRRVR